MTGRLSRHGVTKRSERIDTERVAQKGPIESSGRAMKIAQIVKAKDLRTGDEVLTPDGWQKVTAVDRDAGWGTARMVGVNCGVDYDTFKERDRVLVMR